MITAIVTIILLTVFMVGYLTTRKGVPQKEKKPKEKKYDFSLKTYMKEMEEYEMDFGNLSLKKRKKQ